MKISEDRIYHLSHLIHDRLYLDELVDYIDEDEALRVIKKAMADYLAQDDRLDDVVRHKIQSLKKGVYEGSPEWDVLYRKYYEEEAQKKNF